MKPKVSILILHKNGETIINNCLNSLSKTNYDNFDIHILLNGTTDNSEKIINKYKVKFYKGYKVMGFAEGCNLLIEKTKSKYIVLLNNDTEVDKDWLKELVEFSEKNKADICQPKILDLKDKTKFENAGAAGGFIDKYGYPFCRGRIFGNIEYDTGQYDNNQWIFWACGSCMMIRRSLLEKIGLLDEDFYMYAEELDLCWRANLIGGKIFNVYKSEVYHYGSYSIKREKLDSNKEYLIHRNSLIMFLKNYSSKTIKKLMFKRIMLELMSGLAFPKMMPAIIKTFIYLINNRKYIEKKHNMIQKIRNNNDEYLQQLMLNKSIALQSHLFGKKKFSELLK